MRDRLRRNLLPYTDRAFRRLPPLERPRILDLGCGTGIPTIRLAELAGGPVLGVDKDLCALGALRVRAAAAARSAQVHACMASLDHLPVRDGGFDIAWCEGALFVLGFEASLRAWRRLLRPRAFLVAHDEAGDVAAKLRVARSLGFALLDAFVIDETIWWQEYYRHVADAPAGLADAELLAELRSYRESPERFRSAFLVLATGTA